MKSIREKAKEAERNIHPLFESISESTGEPVSVYDQNDMIDMFEQGANYVLDILEKELPLEDNRNLNYYGRALVWRLKECIEQLKK